MRSSSPVGLYDECVPVPTSSKPLTSLTESLPIIDIASARGGSGDLASIGAALDRACCEFGFFYVTGHGIDPALSARMMTLAVKFFALPLEQKLAIAMAHGGRAWRGYFPVDGELTSGRPDRKEGIYFGTELGPDDARVRAGVPLHGMNLYPALSRFRDTLLAYMDEVTTVGQLLLRGIAVGLGLTPDYFLDRYTRDPTVLFRIFNYPPSTTGALENGLGVGEHSDYGLLTLLRQDEVGGLEVWHQDRWLSAPPVPDSFVCNVGDARTVDGRAVRVCTASGTKRLDAGSRLDAALPGPELRRGAGADHSRCARPFGHWSESTRASLGRHRPGHGQRELRRLLAKQGFESVPATESGSALNICWCGYRSARILLLERIKQERSDPP
jgi:isopenicillin N synthase-like dioxygenase